MAGTVAAELNIQAPLLTLSTGCSSGLDALAAGADMVRRELADVALAGGSDSAMDRYVFECFTLARKLSERNEEPERASRPFDRDRDGGVVVMATLFGLYPFLLKLYADGGYQGPQVQKGLKKAIAQVNVEIVKRSDQAKGFVVLPRRWVVERTFAWLGRCRRLAKDWECLNSKALAFLKLASIRLMVRKLCNQR